MFLFNLNSSLNVRYNPETDKIEAYYNGSWVDVISAGLQDIILYSPGDTHNDVTGGYSVVQNGTLEYNNTNMIFNCSTSGSNTVGSFKTNKIINNIHNKNKLILDLYIYTTGGWSAINLYDAKGNNIYEYKPNDGSALNSAVHHEINLGAIDTDFEVLLTVMRWNAGSTAYIRVDNIYTE